MRGPAGTGRGGISTAGGWQGQGTGNGDEDRGHCLPSPLCVFWNLFMYFGFPSQWGRLLANIRYIYLYTWIFIYFTFISIYIFSCHTHIQCLILYIRNVIIGRHKWILLLLPCGKRVAKYVHKSIRRWQEQGENGKSRKQTPKKKRQKSRVRKKERIEKGKSIGKRNRKVKQKEGGDGFRGVWGAKVMRRIGPYTNNARPTWKFSVFDYLQKDKQRKQRHSLCEAR